MDKPSRFWFWKPSWYWFGAMTLSPLLIGRDEFCRRTVVLGWTVTGRVVVPVTTGCKGQCSNPG